MTSKFYNLEFGRWGESIALKYLEDKGYYLVNRNYRTPYGEIDLVMQIGQRLVFVEVKARSSQKFGYPEEAITETKLTHMIESAQHYLQENSEPDIDWQIDVISVQKSKHQSDPTITHLENVSF